MCAKEEYREPTVEDVYGRTSAVAASTSARSRRGRRSTAAPTAAPTPAPIVADTVRELENRQKPKDATQEEEVRVKPEPMDYVIGDLVSPVDCTGAEGQDGNEKVKQQPKRRKKPPPTGGEEDIPFLMDLVGKLRMPAGLRRKKGEGEDKENENAGIEKEKEKIGAAEYTPAYCRELERRYWRGCGLGKEAWYGADCPGESPLSSSIVSLPDVLSCVGSLYTHETTTWNVACLPSTLSRLLPPGKGLPGEPAPLFLLLSYQLSS